MSSLTFISAFQGAPYAGVSVVDALTTFVCLRDVKRWDGDLEVVSAKFFTAADGSGLERCPYVKDFQKYCTLYDTSFNFSRAFRDFCLTHKVERIGYNPEEVTLADTGTVTQVPVAAQQIADALRMLRGSSLEARVLRHSGKGSALGVLAYFLDSIPADGNLDAALDSPAPVLALVNALIATGELEIQAQRASKQAATAQAAEQAALAREARDPYFHDLRCIERAPGKAKFDFILNNGVRISCTRSQVQVALRHRGGRLASGQAV